jgi:trimeric autotransporter adhesin
MAISTNGLQLVRLAGAVFNQRLSASDYSEILASNKTAAELDAWANAAVASEFRNKTTTDIAKAVLVNVGLSSVAGLEAWVAGQLTAGGGVAKAGATMLAMLNDFSNMSTTEAIYGASVVKFNNKVANSQSQSQTAGTATGTYAAVSELAPSAASATLTLTTGSDSLVGGEGSDTFSAAVSTTGLQTLTGGDKLYGGEGTDTLSAILNAGYTVTPAVLSSIENLEVTSVTNASGIDLANATGLSTVTIAGSSIGTTISNVPTLAVGTSLTGNTGSATVSFLAAAVAGTADAYTVKIANQTGAISFSGIETLTIDAAAGSTNSGLNASATTVNVIGGDVNTTVALGTTTSASVNASTFAGNTFSVTSSASAANVTGGAGNDSVTLTNATGSAAHIVSTGAGVDSITVGGIATNATTNVQTYTSTTGATSISAGDGDDTITFAGGYDATDTIDGGAGTDTLVLKVAGDFAITASQTKMTGIEKVTYSEASATTTKIAGITLKNYGTSVNTLTLSDTTASVSATSGLGAGEDLYDTGTFAFNAGASTFNFTGILNTDGAGGALGLSADGTGTTDSLTLNVSNFTAGVGVAATANTPTITATGIESLTINNATRTNATTYNTFGAISPTSTGGTDASVKFTGTSVSVGAVNAKTVDASGMTSQGAADAGLVMTVGSTSVTAQIITGSGTQDTLYGGGGNDVINGAAGNDSIVAGGGVDSLNGGAGNDTINFATAGEFTTTDSVDGGEGTDTLRLTNSDAGTISAGTTTVSNISNIETLSLSDAAVTSVNITRFGGLSNLQFAGGVNGTPTYSNLIGPVSISYVGAATTVATDTVTASLKTDSGSDTLTVTLAPSANATNDFGNLSGANFETVAINASRTSTNTTSTAALLDLTNTSGTTAVTVSGVTTLATVISSTALASFDASANSAGVNATMTASTVALTATGTSAADTLVSGAGADNISGGDGNDSISSGAGADTINGGGGDDTLDGGAGADSISGGGGTDSLITSSGADTLDGGDGTDSLTISSAAYTNISGYTLAGIETLNANSLAFTSTVSQFQGITTFTNASAVTFTDAGTITGKAGVTSHTLADGTNTVTLYSAAAADQSVLGGTGADTINISSTYLTVADTITGGSGADTVNVTGNTASAATTWIDAISGVETITFANTTTNVSITPVTAVAGTTTLTIDTTAMTSGILTFSGANETDGGTFIVSAGAGADVITGGTGADSIYGGFGGDSITGGAGADTIDLGSGDGAVDTVVIAATTNDLIYSYSIAGRDVIKYIDGGADLVGTAAKVFAMGTQATLKAGTGSVAETATGTNVVVITSAIGTYTAAGMQTVIADIVAGASTDLGDGIIVIAAAATGNAGVWYDAAVANGNSVQVATLVGITLADLANLTTANFAIG